MRRALSPRGTVDAPEAFAPQEGERQRRLSAGSSSAGKTASENGDDNGKQRRGLRRIVMVWNAEKIGLLALFVGALSIGYVSSTWMWQLDMGDSYMRGPQPPSPRQAELDKLDARVHTGIFNRAHFDPPYTRAKYLSYFRPLSYGEAAVDRHGGIRRVDMKTAQELTSLYQRQHASDGLPVAMKVEDDLWEERLYRDAPPAAAHDVERDRLLHRHLDAFIAEEAAYTVRKPPPGSSRKEQRKRFGFRVHEGPLLQLSDHAAMCPAVEKDMGTPMDARRNVLFIIGTQKGGTTFLFNALKKHPTFVGADHAYGQKRGPWAKEVHFFNRWPLPTPPKREYLRCFPPRSWGIAKHPDPKNFTLVDATPDYMFNAMAPPRIKAMWPHAKFLILLRDPIARAYSAWTMSKKMACRQQARRDPLASCQFPTFAEMVVDELRLLKKQRCTFARAGEAHAKSWTDCYGCHVSFAEAKACKRWALHREPCHTPPFLTLSVSTYAPQLAWWLAHFPPEHFKVITSADMHTPDPTPVLNSVINFMDLHAGHFEQSMLRDVWGYKGGYNVTDLTDLDLKAVKLLQLFFRQNNADLMELLQPLGYRGMTPELVAER